MIGVEQVSQETKPGRLFTVRTYKLHLPATQKWLCIVATLALLVAGLEFGLVAVIDGFRALQGVI